MSSGFTVHFFDYHQDSWDSNKSVRNKHEFDLLVTSLQLGLRFCSGFYLRLKYSNRSQIDLISGFHGPNLDYHQDYWDSNKSVQTKHKLELLVTSLLLGLRFCSAM